MQIVQGHSTLKDPRAAVAEATASFESSPDILFVFCSTEQSPVEVHAELTARFPEAEIAGCTTAGEQLGDLHTNGGLVVLGASETGVRWAVDVVHGLDTQTEESITTSIDALVESVGIDHDELAPDSAVCMLFVDGLRGQEERLSSMIADALQGIPLAGGSAGDDLKFAETHVICKEGAFTDAAVFVVAHSIEGGPIRILKHQHFTSTPSMLVVTKAEGRVVNEFDGRPALNAYADALGMKAEEITSDVCFQNPVTFACNGELYVRSIHSIQDDGSLAFYCAVEEGMVVDIGSHDDMCDTLTNDLSSGFPEGAELVVGFNCILRALEATGKELHGELGAIYKDNVNALVGFDTYGEQLNGLHINQTLVAVGFGTPTR